MKFVIKSFLVLIFSFSQLVLWAQQTAVRGIVYDASNGETLAGVNILIDKTKGLVTGENGNFFTLLAKGVHTFQFSFVGYESKTEKISVTGQDTLFVKIKLKPSAINLNTAVVTAGMYMQKLSDVSVSMTVIKPELIQQRNTRNADAFLNKMPGIDILDGQASIRGGGGYSYGAGSRVLLVLDELPLITADAGEVKWNFLPIENTAQIEVLKGASSSLYGSSALNGVINFITVWPGPKPETSVTMYSGVYDKAARKELSWWWDGNPVFNGFRISHSQRFDKTDLVAGADIFSDNGYRDKNYEQHARFNVKLRYRPGNIKGLSAGVSTNIQWQHSSGFFLWQDADSGAFLQQAAGIAPTVGFRVLIDPWVKYFDKHNNKHSLLTRFYKVKNSFDQNADKNNGSDMYYGEYRFYKKAGNKLEMNLGALALHGVTKAALYGDHTNDNLALFTQFDYKITPAFTVSGGYRLEYYSVDGADEKISNVFRAGLNFKAAKYTFLRASFGQGYRYPSIAEKYIATSVGPLNIFPNPQLKPETGWSGEIGAKQGYRLGNVTGFFDAALFWTEYRNMIEFTFGIYKPDSVEIPTLNDIGFKSLNVGKARITGADINISGTLKTGNLSSTFFVGYTYMNPVDLSSDTLENNILKYRYRHSLKGDMAFAIKKLTFGFTGVYRSFMERIDPAFEEPIFGMEIMPGLKQYRQENNKGAFILDVRAAYQITQHTGLSLLAKNIFNKEYMGRPGDIRPPRNFAVQLVVKF